MHFPVLDTRGIIIGLSSFLTVWNNAKTSVLSWSAVVVTHVWCSAHFKWPSKATNPNQRTRNRFVFYFYPTFSLKSGQIDLNLNRIPKYLCNPSPTHRLLAGTGGPGWVSILQSKAPPPPTHTRQFQANPYEWTPNIVLFSTTVNFCRTMWGWQTAICPHHVLKDSERWNSDHVRNAGTISSHHPRELIAIQQKCSVKKMQRSQNWGQIDTER